MARKQHRTRTLRSSGRDTRRRTRSTSDATNQDAAAAELLASFISDDSAMRQLAATAIAERQAVGLSQSDEPFTIILIERLNDPTKDVRLAVVAALEQLETTEEILAALQGRLAIEGDNGVRDRLESSIQTLTGGENTDRVGRMEKLPSEEGEVPREEEPEMESGSGARSGHGTDAAGIQEIASSARSLYLSELPDLLETNRGDWVAYTSNERIVLDRDPEKVYSECCRQGLVSGEFIVSRIEPNVTTEINI